MDNGQLSDEDAAELRPSIRALTIEGFKSIGEKRRIEVRPLTILAGANSSGKSSAIQPLLLLKQTLEAPYDPGALLIHGPNTQFTLAAQMLTVGEGVSRIPGLFGVGIEINTKAATTIFFQKHSSNPINIVAIKLGTNLGNITISPSTLISSKTLFQFIDKYKLFYNLTTYDIMQSHPRDGDESLVNFSRDRCFLWARIKNPPFISSKESRLDLVPRDLPSVILDIIHVPGLRGNPLRNYLLAAVGDRFPGTFDVYVASIIADAQRRDDRPFLDQLATDLRELGLTSHIHARSVDDAQVELRVGRLPTRTGGTPEDLVSIADVGFGVSQTLPVVVALLTAKPGQFVYIEQPELHLHPRAQHAMARLLGRAATRGVQVVIETHSSILLLGVQGLVAKGELDPGRVILHWFTRDEETGQTNIASADLDAAGRFGDWPEDFDDVSLDAQQQYLDAAEKKIAP